MRLRLAIYFFTSLALLAFHAPWQAAANLIAQLRKALVSQSPVL